MKRVGEEADTPPFVSAIVLAAGESTRMGAQNKLLLPVQGRLMIARVVESVIAAKIQEVVVVVGHEAAQIEMALSSFSVKMVHNPSYQQGMSTSIHAGVQAAFASADGYMICLSDQPFIEPGEYSLLAEAFRAAYVRDEKAIVVPWHGSRRGNPVVLSSAYKTAIMAHQGLIGCRSIVQDHPDHVTVFEMPTDHILRDIDTPESYRQLARPGQLE